MGMSRIRALPPDIFADEDLMALPIAARMTGIGLRLHADDYGRETTNTMLLKASLWPATDEITEETLVEHLLQLDEAGYIVLYSDGAKSYYAIVDWPATSHPKPSKCPPPPPAAFQRSAGEPLDDRSAWEREGGSEGEARAGIPPSPFCRIHQPAGTRRDCRHCGTARLAHEQWVRENREVDDE